MLFLEQHAEDSDGKWGVESERGSSATGNSKLQVGVEGVTLLLELACFQNTLALGEIIKDHT